MRLEGFFHTLKTILMDLIILYIVLAIASSLFFWKFGPFWTNFKQVNPNKRQRPKFKMGKKPKGKQYTYDKGFLEYVNKGGNIATWNTEHQTKFKK
jgi:lipopolysaccharide export system protein LptC